jgi:hypothetical protein
VNRFTRRHPNRHFCDGHHTNVTPGNPETFLGMMVEEMIAANPTVSELEAACRSLRRNISIPKLLKKLKRQNKLWRTARGRAQEIGWEDG